MEIPWRLRSRDLARIAQTALAAGASWELALQLPNHGQPFFAPIAAVIALGAEHGRRGKQAIAMMTGVAVGILVGAGTVAVAGTGWWQLVAAVAVSLLLTVGAGGGQMLRNQAAASAILIVALHTPGQNLALQRLVDALIGGGIAVLLAQILFPIDPVAHVLDATRALRNRVADDLEEVAAALDARDLRRANAALERVDRIDERRAEEALALAREVVRRAPRRRRQRDVLEMLSLDVHELSALVADAHTVAAGAVRLLETLPDAAADAAAVVHALVGTLQTVDLAENREWSKRVRAATDALRARDESMDAELLVAGAEEVAAHALRAAEARASAEGRHALS
ncbi:MAG: FUSC family protein [Gaiellaceae bacterium]